MLPLAQATDRKRKGAEPRRPAAQTSGSARGLAWRRRRLISTPRPTPSTPVTQVMSPKMRLGAEGGTWGESVRPHSPRASLLRPGEERDPQHPHSPGLPGTTAHGSPSSPTTSLGRDTNSGRKGACGMETRTLLVWAWVTLFPRHPCPGGPRPGPLGTCQKKSKSLRGDRAASPPRPHGSAAGRREPRAPGSP